MNCFETTHRFDEHDEWEKMNRSNYTIKKKKFKD